MSWHWISVWFLVVLHSTLFCDRVSGCFSEYSVSWWGHDGSENNYTLSASHFQMKVKSFYASPLDGKRPPLKESYFLAKTPRDFVFRMIEECPPVPMFVYFLIAEAKYSIDPWDPLAEKFFSVGLSVLSNLKPEIQSIYVASWPVNEAISRIERLASPERLNYLHNHYRNKDLIRVVYLTTANSPMESTAFLNTILPNVSRIDFMHTAAAFTAETALPPVVAKSSSHYLPGYSVCEAIAMDILSGNPSESSDWTIYLNGHHNNDFSLEYVSLFIQAINAGTLREARDLRMPPLLFLALGSDYLTGHTYQHGHPKAYAQNGTATPIAESHRLQDYLHHVLEPLPDLQSVTHRVKSYGNSIFAIHKDIFNSAQGTAIKSILESILTQKQQQQQPGDGELFCKNVLDYLWHLIFQQDGGGGGSGRALLSWPLRADDSRLPVGLRLKYGNEHAREKWEDVEFGPVIGIDVFDQSRE